MKKIIFLVGPTAVGKTAVSIYLSKLIDAEIISCDSMQVYKGMDIGTQKPTKYQLKKAPHHMINIIAPTRNFSVADFRKKALESIDKIIKKNKTPLFAGGTALYMKALIDGLFPSPKADKTLRAELKKEERKNPGILHKKLVKIDPKAAKLLHPNDTRRVVRALELYMQTNTPISELKKKTKGLKSKYKIKIFCMNRDRQKLYKDIEKRVDLMFKKGLVSECRRLKKKKLSMTAKQALGYRETFDYLDLKISLKEAKAFIKRNTRRFAKRQLSWFRNDNRIIWVNVDGKTPKEIAKIIKGNLELRT